MPIPFFFFDLRDLLDPMDPMDLMTDRNCLYLKAYKRLTIQAAASASNTGADGVKHTLEGSEGRQGREAVAHD